MQFKRCAVVGVLVMLCLSTDSRCLYVPERKAATSSKRSDASAPSSHSEQIQICGKALTSFIIEACDGILGSFNQGNSTRNSVQTKITEDCCEQGCPLDYLQNYCGKTPLFAFKTTLRGKLLKKLTKNRGSGSGADGGAAEEKKKKKGVQEVRVEGGKENRGRKRKKRKKSFKWNCAYKSFGHYLLKLDRSSRGRGPNGVNRTWPSIEIGTISPEVEKFGGQPIIVVRKNKSNSS